jgi:hypothetical protein
MNVYQMPFAIGEMMIDNTMKSVQAYGLAMEQGDKMTRLALDQSKVVREEGMKMAQKWGEMARENQRQATSLYSGFAQMGLDGFKSFQQQATSEMSRQMDTVAKQMEVVNAKVGKN